MGRLSLPAPSTGPPPQARSGPDKKNIMQTIVKLAHLGTPGGLSPLSDRLGHVLRALVATALDLRPARPLQDLDGWSDQAEVAYYEGCWASRCL